jgi:succinoglycan biosynthesis protein ExoV
LNHRLPKHQKKVIFGSGAGYGDEPQVDSNWRIYFVRGQLTAKALEIDSKLAITDSAILIRKLFTASGQKSYKKSYMPHYMEAVINGVGWRRICEDLDIQYIDPTEPLQNVLAEVSKTEICLLKPCTERSLLTLCERLGCQSKLTPEFSNLSGTIG